MFHLLYFPLVLSLALISEFIIYLIIALLIIVAIKAIVIYVFESIFIYKITKNKTYNYPIISFIPFINKYYLGKIANSNKIGISILINHILIIIWFSILCIPFFIRNDNNIINSFLYKTFFVIIILFLVNFILNIYLTHKITKEVLGKKAVFLTLLNIFTLGISRPIVLFAIRKKLYTDV